MQSKTSFCITTSIVQASQIVELLKDEGFTESQISVLFPDKESTPTGTTGDNEKHETKGGGLGWFAGAGALDVPGIGRIVALGPIITIFSSDEANDTPNRLAKALINLGIPEAEAHHYEANVKDGSILIAVPAQNVTEMKTVDKIFGKLSTDHLSADAKLAEIKPA